MPQLCRALLLCLWLTLGSACLAQAPATDAAEEAAFVARREQYLTAMAARPLKLGPNPGTWVDVERWCVAHARLTRGEGLAEANQYLAEVSYASLWEGLVADSDVQVTDLLRTYLEFRASDRLTPAAKAQLEAQFRAWTVPNRDRNRDADTRYEWPCEYTENHSLNILVGAYLIDAVLARDRALRRGLLQRFLHDRARWGWSEFHSPSYAVVTAKVLALLADHAPDAELATAARYHLDLLVLTFANQAVGRWRGVPFARGYGSQVNNASNSFVELARLWFGAADDKDAYRGGTFLAHLLTSSYRPPPAATWLLSQPAARGTHTLEMTVTHGPARQRVPISQWVSPLATIAAAQGWGSYYDGCYWSISFASAPNRVLTGRYGGGRNLLLVDNTLAVFGEVNWHGKFTMSKEEGLSIGDDGAVFVGQLAVAPELHLILVDEMAKHADRAAFAAALRRLAPTWEAGELRWVLPDGRPMHSRHLQVAGQWRLQSATVAETEWPLDRNWLVSSPWLRGERDSAITEVRIPGRGWRYDLRDPAKPTLSETPGAPFAAPPPDLVTGPLGMRFRRVPGGEFPRGSPASEGRTLEQPQHWVSVPGFYLAETEVTVAQYRAFLAANPTVTPPPEWYWKDWGKSDLHPMTWVSWAEANAFCQWLSTLGQGRYRLPSESEWEKAAKGYGHRAYPWGEEYDGSQSGNKNGIYIPVATKPGDRGPFGHLDLAGNAWEWCADTWDPAAWRRHLGWPTGELGEPVPALRSVRGCGWNFDPDTFRASYRSGFPASDRSVHLGFRVAKE